MVSQIKVNKIIKQSGSSVEIGESGDSINIVGNTAITGTISSTGTTFGGNNDNYFQAYRPGTNASPSANTWTAYVYNSTLVNNNSVYDTSSGEFTVPADGAGRYFFHSQFWASQIDDGESAEIAIWDDISGSFASSEARTRSSFGFGTGTDKGFACKVSCILDLSVGDKVKTYVKVTSGGIFANSGYNYFLGYKLA
tara:strand:+ start:517 stop:1104 length:588 start_codon:yes stop_codon:yes gene_type:complete